MAEELGCTEGAAKIRGVNKEVDEALGESHTGWGKYSDVNDWLSQIKNGANNPISHSWAPSTYRGP